MLDIQFSNRFELLAELLAARIGVRRGSAFDSDVVLVPSSAIRRRLTLDIARSHRICANLQFGYLAQWLWQQLARFDPRIGAESPFDQATLTWHAYAAFGDPAWYGRWPRLSAYVRHADDRMRFELARQVAGAFSHYVTYRTDWLQAWQQGHSADPAGSLGQDEPWQQALWQRIATALSLEPVNPLLAFARSLQTRALPQEAFPNPVHIFCLPDIAPLHLELLRALAQHGDLYLYALNPCAEYWFDVVDPRRLAYLQAAGRLDHHQVGHRLLAGWAKQSQAHLRQLVETTEFDLAEATFHPSDSPQLLGRLQDSILHLQELAPGSVPMKAGDRSLEVHVCHSRSRELEVLHDRLLGLFREYPDLSPDQILVVTPDLQATAPLIDAVFGTAPRERHIPYQITGLARSILNPAASALLALLDLAGSRWLLSDVLGLLEKAPICSRLNLDRDALEGVRTWLRDAGVRWGLDDSHRAALGLPPSAAHSFQDGLDRLFLGYALPDGWAQPFAGLLPAGAVQGGRASWLGAVWQFIASLRSLREELGSLRTAAQWADFYLETTRRFIDERDSPEDFHELLAVLDAFGRQSDGQGIDTLELPADVARLSLQDFLDDPGRGGVPSGVVTFAAISSLRSIPYRVVCVIGLDQGALPGLSRPHEFDLMAAYPRRLDRQRQSDDRNLFLDQLLAARQTLHLSYVGRSVRDNAPLPPSVLLAELLDHLTLVIADDPTLPESLAAARDLLVIEHPLQPFSERSFPDAAKDGTKSKIASYNAEYAAALRARAGAVPRQLAHASLNSELNTDDGSEDADDQRDLAPEGSAVFFAQALPEPEAQLRSLTLDALERFLRNPCRELLERRLGLQLPRRDQELRDDESFLPDWQDRNDLSARLLPLLIDGADLQRVEQLAQAGTEVPPGALGLVGLRQTLHQMQQFAAQVRPMLREPVLAPHLACIELTVQGELWRLDASFSDLRAPGLVRYRDRLASPSDYLSAWLHQLVLWICPPVNLNPQVCWILRDTSIRFARNQDPRELLGQLIALYRQGMREPLAFFPKTSMAFANANWQFSSKVHSIWAGASHGERTVPGERDDPAVRLAWRGVPDPVRSGIPAFEQCARTVFEPLLAQLRHD